ncbi:hypothetical protein BGX27_005780, partial [Mortierella sp. AM989]
MALNHIKKVLRLQIDWSLLRYAYHNTRKERSEFWKGLRFLEDYNKELKPLVVRDKLATAQQHSREYDQSSTAHITNIISLVANKKRKIHMQEPYKRLLDAAYKVHREGMIKVTERDISNLTPIRRGLYELALDSLVCFQHDQENVSPEKDAFVALSCMLDLAGPKLQGYFEEDILKRARDSCSLQRSSSGELTTILEP